MSRAFDFPEYSQTRHHAGTPPPDTTDGRTSDIWGHPAVPAKTASVHSGLGSGRWMAVRRD